MENLKIGFLARDLSSSSGYGKYAHELIEKISQRGHACEVWTLVGVENQAIKSVKIWPVLSALRDTPLKPWRVLRDWLRVKDKMKGMDVIHCLAEPMAPLAFLVALSAKAPLFITAHGTYATNPLAKWWGAFYRLAYNHAAAIAAVSDYTVSRLVSLMPSLQPKAHAIISGVNYHHFNPPGHDYPGRELAFLSVGSIKPRKGTLELVQAFALVAKRFPSAKLYIVGRQNDQSYLSSVQQEIRNHDLGPQIIFLGQISNDELTACYHRVRGLVMPSINSNGDYEGFGLVHLEANACGTPAIGSLNSGNESAIADNESGYLVRQGDVHGLSIAMSKLLDNDKYWAELSKNAALHAQKMNWDRVADQYIQLYRQLVNQ